MDVAGLLDQYAAVGLLLAGLSIPLIVGLVPPNRFYGFRTVKTLSDARIWYAVNRVAGWDTLAAGVTIVLASLAIAMWGSNRSADTRTFVSSRGTRSDRVRPHPSVPRPCTARGCKVPYCWPRTDGMMD